jgi:hypothetical protein
MLGTSTIQQYFASGNSHYITPQVSFEWNYNLFYAPYSTTNGTGTTIIPTGTWYNTPTTSNAGKITSVFLADAGQTTRSCLLFTATSANPNTNPPTPAQGSSTLTISNITSTTNTYKISFYAKVDRDAAVKLSALAYIDYHRSHSQSQDIDSVTWTKFEVYLSAQPYQTNSAYSNPQLALHHSATDGATTYGILIDQLEIHQTTDFEYRYGNLWTTSSPFNAFRPGESYVSSGNSLVQRPSNYRQVKYDFQSSIYSFNNQTMPVSPVVYHPTLLTTNKSNPIYKSGYLSEWSQYKYFVADKDNQNSSTTQSLTGIYDQVLNANKIVIKFNLSYSTPTAFTVTLSNTTTTGGTYTTNYTNTVSLTNSDIDSSGTCILYLQSDGSWKSANAGYTWSTTPQFDFNGVIRFGGNNGSSATKQINKITVTQTSSSINGYYSSHSSSKNLDVITYNDDKTTSKVAGTVNDDSAQMQRMQVVEISPRLEVDVSYFTMSVDTTAELDNKMNPLPISAISANMSTITLSNVPLTVSSQVLSLFSNNSTGSVLKGLFRNYVKCYVNYVIKDSVSGATSSDKFIPGGVFYVDTWDGRDIEKTVVTAYDITKYLQLAQPTDYVAQTQDAFRLISNVLDFAGFTDYNYDELRRVTKSTIKLSDGTIKNNSTPLLMRYFYVDGTQQKVFDVLREIFEVYQIAAYIDAYGVMRFINVDGIFDPSNQINMLLHDNSTPQSITTGNGYSNNLTVSSNIVQDTYTETVKTKLGKANLTYKTPQVFKTLAADGQLLDNNLYVTAKPTYQTSSSVIWDSTIDESTTYNHLAQSMNLYDNKFRVPDNEATAATGAVNFNTYGIDHDGYGIIEGEIVSFKYKEFSFVAPATATTPLFSTTRSVANSSEFAATFAEVVAQAGINANISVAKTGYITNVDRGMFNTPIRTHLKMGTLSDIQQKFSTSSATAVSIKNGDIMLTSNSGEISKLVCLDPYTVNDYNTFSTKILMGVNSATAYPTGTKAGLVLNDVNQNPSLYVAITQQKDSKGKDQYLLTVNKPNGSSMIAGTNKYVDITYIVNAQADLYPLGSPFADYGKYLNLKFVKGSAGTNKFEVFINRTRATLVTISDALPDTSGPAGLFVSGHASSVMFSEIYSTQTAINDPNIFYHYQFTWFAEKIASNKKIFEISYIVQASPVIIGINYYDIKDAQAPSLDAYPLKIQYDWYYITDPTAPTPSITAKNTTTPNLPYISVDQYALNYSPIYHSGFRSKFAIVNCSPSQVWIKKSADSINKINVDFSLITDTLITLGPDTTISKVFDEANINETVDITSSWVQDKNTATSILRTIYRALDGFSRDTTISIYGNPLYEIGDIVKINYGLKNIVGQKYFVQGIEQTFDTGLTTILTLNQIG